MTIILYQNKSEPIYVNKDITEFATLPGTLRASSSVTTPNIRIQSANENIMWVNYMYIVEWGRYYFVNDIISIRKNLWEFRCHVDVLMTYRNQLMPLKAIIARQENLYNLYLDDDKFLVNAQRMYWTKAFPNRVLPASSGGSSFILTVAGGEDAEE